MTDAGQPCPILFDQLSAAVQRSVGPQAPGPLKLMTARGMAPMAPRDLVTAQFVLTFDGDAKVAQAAQQALGSLDQRLANAVLGDVQLHPEVLGYLAQALATNDAYAEKLLLNPKTPSLAFAAVAEVCSEAIAEIIANNQARLLEAPEIARSLTKNPNALRSSIDRVVDFLVRNGVILDDVHHFEEAYLRLTGEERQRAADTMELPEHLLDDSFRSEGRRLIDEEDDEPEDEEARKSLQEILRNASIAQKVALATKGNKSVRSELMRDTNRLVALAAVSSPAITEMEVIAASNSRTVHADVILHIVKDKKNNWTRNYQVKLALVNNPKCPIADALRLVPSI
ncbi:MAG: hypothetical protein KC933_29540, partial [Myxococcales bacterium]|nr:hypothetical protein [Myxococcales bacterium]